MEGLPARRCLVAGALKPTAAPCAGASPRYRIGTMIEVGKPAPAFSLLNQDGLEVGLQDFAGRWLVLYFYPRDDTPGCTKEACEFTADIRAFQDMNAFVFGCSPDSPESHVKFMDKYHLMVELLSDPDKKAMRAYDAYGEKVLYGKKTTGTIRSTVIITPDGRIARHWRSVKAAGHAAVVRAALAELQGVTVAADAPAAPAKKPAKTTAKAAATPAAKTKAAAKGKPKPAAKPKPASKPQAKAKAKAGKRPASRR